MNIHICDSLDHAIYLIPKNNFHFVFHSITNEFSRESVAQSELFSKSAQSAGAEEYTDCIFAKE